MSSRDNEIFTAVNKYRETLKVTGRTSGDGVEVRINGDVLFHLDWGQFSGLLFVGQQYMNRIQKEQHSVAAECPYIGCDHDNHGAPETDFTAERPQGWADAAADLKAMRKAVEEGLAILSRLAPPAPERTVDEIIESPFPDVQPEPTTARCTCVRHKHVHLGPPYTVCGATGCFCRSVVPGS